MWFTLELMRTKRKQIRFHLDQSQTLMKVMISFIISIGLGLTCTVFADNYTALVAKGYRWVTVHGPYACTSEQGVRRITANRSEATEMLMVAQGQAYYLIPGTIVQIFKEDPAAGMSQIRLGGLTTPLWTYTRFLSPHPIEDIYGTVETPENSGLIPSVDTAPSRTLTGPAAAQTGPNGNP
jgi:hypothetical protein